VASLLRLHPTSLLGRGADRGYSSYRSASAGASRLPERDEAPASPPGLRGV